MIAHYLHNDKPIDWTESARRCEELKAKDRLYKDTTEIQQGAWVRLPDGREGRVTHKEYCYFSKELGREVWFIQVITGAMGIHFNDVHDLKKVPEPKKTRSVLLPEGW